MLLPGTADTSAQTEARVCAKTDLQLAGKLALLGGRLGKADNSHVIAAVSDCDGKRETVFMAEDEQNALLLKLLCGSAALFPKSQFPLLLMSAKPINHSLSSLPSDMARAVQPPSLEVFRTKPDQVLSDLLCICR